MYFSMKNILAVLFLFVLFTLASCTSYRENLVSDISEKDHDSFYNTNENPEKIQLPPCHLEAEINCDRSKVFSKFKIVSNQCEGSDPVNFTSPPRKLEDIDFILPMGLMKG